MRYVSTRGGPATSSARDAILSGTAPDGGLWMPEAIPQLPAERIAELAELPYPDLAALILSPFIGDAIDDQRLLDLCIEAYAGFDDPEVAPLVPLAGRHWLLELFRGPTLAFKDFALQVLGRVLAELVGERPLVLVGATSGDTGSAAIAAVAGRPNIALVMLHPEGRVSEVQRRQMTTVDAPNIVNLAVRGSFDDCQRLVKQLFAEGVGDLRLGAVNSINWLRIAAQVPYYFAAAAKLNAIEHPVAFAVPSGNFGNACAGYVARAMGLPIERLIIATNSNDILHRAFTTGLYERGEALATTAPAMDIQVASNFERMLFVADREAVPEQMKALAENGRFHLTHAQRDLVDARFSSASADEPAIVAATRWANERAGQVIDPHTAAGLHAALHSDLPHDVPIVTLGTAHPAKFPDAVAAALGERPPMTEALQEMFARPELYEVVDADAEAIAGHVRKLAGPSA
ncbi:threonine synthase [Pseudoblastomonas halimionae]|uniref:Threonine synthase n=1 Tax=Alteriqipengyuania halimionae TaxID=1926630 RepID=A0A6I4TYV5_9SPHN|nr:threonine synthase [Alteriqipengyuania halimionae]MXP08716.1 threonine synthase [Alteriqipengyuania halimionae]